MKRERYVKEILKVVDQAKDEHELELMRLAVIEARARIENKAYAIKQENFRLKNGGK